MKGNEVRSSFLDFFRSKGHTIVPSDSLIPANDPTLLFTNAGMNQFKDVFLGTGKRSYRRAANSQKCIRVSGKHNDLEQVGHDTYHHTFFEMLGNWSFGDYYKREAIQFAWELLTEVWKIPKEKLWATVYEEDDESEEYWYQETDILKGRVLRFGAEDNFWEMGETGPCGPCSEIHIDLGPDACQNDDPDHVCGVNTGCPRFVELWNLVFMQYNRNERGELEPLPERHVDTGMGLERIVAVLQDRRDDYLTDLFMPIVEMICELSGYEYHSDSRGTPHRVLADHSRCAAFAIADGVMPSNEGRGYVIRRIIRRAILYGKRIGMDKPFIWRLVEPIQLIMGDAYPEVRERREFIERIIKSEEERFHRTLDRGLEILEEELERLKAEGGKVIPGRKAFELYDTYGFPLDLTQLIARERGFVVDEMGFRRAMDEQRERGRASWRGDVDYTKASVYADVLKEFGPTQFIGYETLNATAKVVALIRSGEMISSASRGKEVEVVLDRTPFYGEAGGQVGDKGRMISERAVIEVIDAFRPSPDLIVHRCRILEGELLAGDEVKAQVNEWDRLETARAHTATHLLHAALRKVLGEHARQSGSLVEPGRLRFDFSHYEALSQEELFEIERTVNRWIMQDMPVNASVMRLEEAREKGAIALFGEKYGEMVRVITIGNISSELCGGTHLRRTGQIGLFKIVSEGSIAAGIRRIEAVVGEKAYLLQREIDLQLGRLAELLKVKREEVVGRVERLLEETRELRKEISRLESKMASSQVSELLGSVQEIEGVKLVTHAFSGVPVERLRSMVDEIKNRMGSVVTVLGSDLGGKVVFVAGVTPDLVRRGIKAGDIVREVAKITGGGGGGRPEMAQAGGRDPSKLTQALEAAPQILRRLIRSGD
ncbi:alanine--tRNA ligase [Candidatus Poribacteria bacterium]|nr:alanine--tRNA ligase [Candidatus Poribacteria bacterium]